MIRIGTLQAGAQCYLPILSIPFRTQLNADSALHGKDASKLKWEWPRKEENTRRKLCICDSDFTSTPARSSTISIPIVCAPPLNSASPVVWVTAAGLPSPEMPTNHTWCCYHPSQFLRPPRVSCAHAWVGGHSRAYAASCMCCALQCRQSAVIGGPTSTAPDSLCSSRRQ